MADNSPTPPAPAPAPEASGGCGGFLLGVAFWATLWLGACFLLFWKVGTAAAAIGFFAPPLGLALWALFSKPAKTEAQNKE